MQIPPALYSSFNLSNNEFSSQVPMSMAMSHFGIAAAAAAALYGNANLPLPDSNTMQDADDSKTIPIPLMLPHAKPGVQEGFYIFDEDIPCPDGLCMYFGKKHYHCSQPRCYYVTDRSDILVLHSKDFHDNIDITEGFVFFDRSVDCRMPNCQSNKINRHFHCTRVGCNYTFVRYSTMSIHEEKHKNENSYNDNLSEGEPTAKRSKGSNSDDDSDSAKSSQNSNCINNTSNSNCSLKSQVVKAAGTYYPLSAFTQNRMGQSYEKVSIFDKNKIIFKNQIYNFVFFKGKKE